MTATRKPAPIWCPPITKDDAQALDLYDSGRWVENATPTNCGKDFIYCANYYGISGATQDPKLYRENEILIAAAILRAISFGNVPYYIVGDFNINPKDSEVIKAAIEAGVIMDVPAVHADHPDKLSNTFRRRGPYKRYARSRHIQN